MPHAIRFSKVGGPEVLQWEEVSVPQPGSPERERTGACRRASSNALSTTRDSAPCGQVLVEAMPPHDVQKNAWSKNNG